MNHPTYSSATTYKYKITQEPFYNTTKSSQDQFYDTTKPICSS